MRIKEPPRVVGPYQERERWRIVLVENAKRKSIFLDTEEEALRAKAELERRFLRPISQKLCDVIDLWEQELLRRRQVSPDSTSHAAKWARKMTEPMLEEPISALTPAKAAALYNRFLSLVSSKTKQPYSVATHRMALWCARSFFLWANANGVCGNPFKEVKPIGKPRAGKPQLRIEEARRFTRTALERFEKNGHPLNIAALVALMMGMRTKEVLIREVRDLDDGGRFLWIDAGKTVNAKRHLEVPDLLRPYLVQLTVGKAPNALLFGGQSNGKPRRRQLLWLFVQRLCKFAAVPRVCTHSLRGLHATLAVQSGSAAHVVAASLGHGSFEMTERHYAQPSAVANAATARVTSILDQLPASPAESVVALATRLRAKFNRLELLQLAHLLTAEESTKHADFRPANRSAIDPQGHF